MSPSCFVRPGYLTIWKYGDSLFVLSSATTSLTRLITCSVSSTASLKVIQQALGIRTKLHSHLARHTFATRALRLGAKIENVSRMLGHTNITQTQRYAKVLAQSVHDDFELINEKLNSNEK